MKSLKMHVVVLGIYFAAGGLQLSYAGEKRDIPVVEAISIGLVIASPLVYFKLNKINDFSLARPYLPKEVEKVNKLISEFSIALEAMKESGYVAAVREGRELSQSTTKLTKLEGELVKNFRNLSQGLGELKKAVTNLPLGKLLAYRFKQAALRAGKIAPFAAVVGGSFFLARGIQRSRRAKAKDHLDNNLNLTETDHLRSVPSAEEL